MRECSKAMHESPDHSGSACHAGHKEGRKNNRRARLGGGEDGVAQARNRGVKNQARAPWWR